MSNEISATTRNIGQLKDTPLAAQNDEIHKSEFIHTPLAPAKGTPALVMQNTCPKSRRSVLVLFPKVRSEDPGSPTRESHIGRNMSCNHSVLYGTNIHQKYGGSVLVKYTMDAIGHHTLPMHHRLRDGIQGCDQRVFSLRGCDTHRVALTKPALTWFAVPLSSKSHCHSLPCNTSQESTSTMMYTQICFGTFSMARQIKAAAIQNRSLVSQMDVVTV